MEVAGELVVEDAGTDLEQQVGAAGCPAHLLFFRDRQSSYSNPAALVHPVASDKARGLSNNGTASGDNGWTASSGAVTGRVTE